MFRFDEENDCYYCPAAFMIPFTRIQKRQEKPDLKQYVCNDCHHCVLKNACTKAECRTISRDPREYLLENMRAKLRMEAGQKLYLGRMYTVEPVFGQMKQNRGFREFLLRGRDKVKVEFIMMCIVHNIEKIGGFMENKGLKFGNILLNGILVSNVGNLAKNIAFMACSFRKNTAYSIILF